MIRSLAGLAVVFLLGAISPALGRSRGRFIQSVPPTPSTQRYWIWIPATSRTCQEEADALVDRFARATGVQKAIGTCQGTSEETLDSKPYTLYSLSVDYESPQIFAPVSAIFGRGGGSDSAPGTRFTGAYRNLSACLDDLPRQAEVYQAETGLSPVASYCMRGENPVNPGGYVLQIDGFGNPRKQFYVAGPDYVSGAAAESLGRSYSQFLTGFGATIVRRQGATIYYYSERPLSIRLHFMADFRSEEDCPKQIAEANEILSNLGGNRFFVFCRPTNVQRKWFALEAISEGAGDWMDQEPDVTPDGYHTLDECRRDQPRILDTYRRTHVREVLGGLCTDTLGDGPWRFKLRVFTRLY